MSNLLEVRNVVKRFGGLTAVNELSFHVEPGESLGLIGPNGAGGTKPLRGIGAWPRRLGPIQRFTL